MDGFDESKKKTEIAILEDYVVIGSPHAGALIHREATAAFSRGVAAAVISANMGLSLSYAERRYVSPERQLDIPESYAAFQHTYQAAMDHLRATLARFNSREDENGPPAGVLFADVALRRLEGTFFAAGLLFRTGHLFEARAVARIVLEQIAWAYAVRTAPNVDVAAKVSPTRAIGVLKRVLPEAGRLYGSLSSESHLELDSHYKFLDLSGTHAQVRLTHGPESWRSGTVLLDLADYWSIVYEATQTAYIAELENWTRTKQGLKLRTDRPFVALITQLRRERR